MFRNVYALSKVSDVAGKQCQATVCEISELAWTQNKITFGVAW